MDPLITQISERARKNDPRLRHISLRSLPLLQLSNEEMVEVVCALEHNTYVSTFDISIHDENDVTEGDERTNAIFQPRRPLNQSTIPSLSLAQPFERVFSHNSSLVDVRISSSSSSILAAVFRGLAYNKSVQILQVGDVLAQGATTPLSSEVAWELRNMLQHNTAMHRLVLQGFQFHQQESNALQWVSDGLRANQALRVLELLQISIIPSANETAPSLLSEPLSASWSTFDETRLRYVVNGNKSVSGSTIKDKTETADLMMAIGSMNKLQRLCIIACDMAELPFSCTSSTQTLPLNMDVDIPMNTKLKSKQVAPLGTISHDTATSSSANKPQLEELRLVECELTGPSIQSLRQTWQNNPHLRLLDVRGNALQEDGCMALGHIIRTATCLNKVVLEDNQIGNAGLIALCHYGLQHANLPLEHLSLRENQIGSEGIDVLASALQQGRCCPHLQSVDLSYNQVGDGGATALGHMLMRNATVEELILENASIEGTGILGLCQGLKANATLMKLNLSGNTLGVTGINAICALLCEDSLAVLEESSFDHTNNINLKSESNIDSAATTIGSRSCSLKSLRLASCQLGDAGVSAIAKALEYNHTLEEIILPFNRFGDDGAMVIGQCLPNWKGVSSLQIQFNLFSEVGFGQVVHGLSKNVYLKSLYLLNAGPSNRRIDNLFQEMQHWIRLNKGGRRALLDDDTSATSLTPALWPLILAKAGKAYPGDAVYHLLTERPNIISAPGL